MMISDKEVQEKWWHMMSERGGSTEIMSEAGVVYPANSPEYMHGDPIIWDIEFSSSDRQKIINYAGGIDGMKEDLVYARWISEREAGWDEYGESYTSEGVEEDGKDYAHCPICDEYISEDVVDSHIDEHENEQARESYANEYSAKFERSAGSMKIGGKTVKKIWESFTGWYWYGIENQGDGTWYGYVQGFENEWGYFSEDELNSMKGQVWEVPKSNWEFTGRSDSFESYAREDALMKVEDEDDGETEVTVLDEWKGESWDRKTFNQKMNALEAIGFRQGKALRFASLAYEDFSEDMRKQLDNYTEEDAEAEQESINQDISEDEVDYNNIGESRTARTKYECEFCNSGFKSNESLSLHYNDIHAVRPVQSGDYESIGNENWKDVANDLYKKEINKKSKKTGGESSDVIKAQYDIQGSCPICGRVNRPYTKDDLNGHDPHRHGMDGESYASEKTDYGYWNHINSPSLWSSSFDRLLKEIGEYDRWSTMTENEKIYIVQFSDKVDDGLASISDYKPYGYESYAREEGDDKRKRIKDWYGNTGTQKEDGSVVDDKDLIKSLEESHANERVSSDQLEALKKLRDLGGKVNYFHYEIDPYVMDELIDFGLVTDTKLEGSGIVKLKPEGLSLISESYADEFGDLDILQISDNITPKEQEVDYLRDLGISDKTLREIGLLKRKQIDRGESYATEDDYQYDYDELTSLAQDKLDDGGVSQDEWDGSSEEEKKDIENQVKDGDY
jgi:rubrerythrin